MPNYCYYTISVGGRTENVNKFIEIMQNDYDKVHMYRIFEANPYFVNQYGMYTHAQIDGYCAWSVSSCMLPGPYSYYNSDFNRCKNTETDRYYDGRRGIVEEICTMFNFNGTHLLELAKYLNLTIQIYSTEPGMCFCEDGKILPNGLMVRDNCGNYQEWYLEDFNSYKDMLDEYGISEEKCPFSEEEFNQMRDAHQDCYEIAEYEFEDEIPDQPKYLAKNILYKLRKDNK